MVVVYIYSSIQQEYKVHINSSEVIIHAKDVICNNTINTLVGDIILDTSLPNYMAKIWYVKIFGAMYQLFFKTNGKVHILKSVIG